MSSDTSDPKFIWEQAFARNMASAREAQGLSQNEFARRLRERGLPFHQATVQRVESMDRSVRLDEAFVIAAELGYSLNNMVQSRSELSDKTLRYILNSARIAESTATSTARSLANVEFLLRQLSQLNRELNRAHNVDVSVSTKKRVKRLEEVAAKLEKQLLMAGDSATQMGRIAGLSNKTPKPEGWVDGEHQEESSVPGKGIGALIPRLDDGEESDIDPSKSDSD